MILISMFKCFLLGTVVIGLSLVSFCIIFALSSLLPHPIFITFIVVLTLAFSGFVMNSIVRSDVL